MNKQPMSMDEIMMEISKMSSVQLAIIFTHLTDHIIQDEVLLKQVQKATAEWLYYNPTKMDYTP